MLTVQKWQELVEWAGPDFMWENGPKLGTRGNSAARAGLRAFLLDYSNRTCVFCGTEVGTRVGEHEMCHIVAAGPTSTPDGKRIRRGYVPANIAIGCTPCNADQVERYGQIVPMSGILLPDRVPHAWPTETELREAGRARSAA
jgi:hypothetical protein